MSYKKCPICDLNFIIDSEEMCNSCKMDKKINSASGTFIISEGYNVQFLDRGIVYDYQNVESSFNIKIKGFGRGINPTDDAVVLISSIKKEKGFFVYHDHWTKEGEYIFSGEGAEGNQTLTKGNKAIVEAEKVGKIIYLFIKESPDRYYFQGPVELIDYTYEDDKDKSGNIRKEYKFRLRKIKI